MVLVGTRPFERLSFARSYERNAFPDARAGRPTCSVWGWVHRHGVGEVVAIDGKFSPDEYVEILEEVMLPSVRAYAVPPPDTIVYMHDRCRVYRSPVVRQWFQDRESIDLLEWPSEGGDLNPIEGVWAGIAAAWDPAQRGTKEELLGHIRREWEAMRGRPELVSDQVSSLPDKLRSVIDAKGSWTRG